MELWELGRAEGGAGSGGRSRWAGAGTLEVVQEVLMVLG